MLTEKELGERLKNVREVRHISQFRLGEMTECGQAHIGKLEKGEHYPKIPTLYKISDARGVPASDILAESPPSRNRACAAVFFMQFLTANADRIAIENPVGFINTAFRSADQTIHPYMFAESTDDTEQYVTKATCLWLVNLPKLKTNGLPKPDNGKLFGKLPSGKNRTWEDTYSRSGKVRSKTFPGIARAMAEQWGGDIREEAL